MVSVLILTLNEEINLPTCLEAVSWSDDIVVLDSGSTDATVEIAQAFGARVVTRPFDDERSQRMFSVREISYKNAWVFNPDADEVATPELSEEILRLTADPAHDEVAYRMRRKDMFMGRWLHYSSLYPTWLMRLFRPETISFDRIINLNAIVDGSEGLMQEHLLHYSFAKGMDDWKTKHRRYALAEAHEALEVLRSGRIDWAGLVQRGDAVRKRRAMKELSFRVPCRPLLRFAYMYILRRGILDGRPGLAYCRLIAWYEAMIVRNLKQLKAEAA